MMVVLSTTRSIPLLSTWHELGDIHAGSGSIDNKELGDALSDLGMATTSEKIEVRIFSLCVCQSNSFWHDVPHA
jgi:hypothetical protein